MDFGPFFRLILGIFYVSGMSPVTVHTPQSAKPIHWRAESSHKIHKTRDLFLTIWSLLTFIALCVLIVVAFNSDGFFRPHNYIGEFNDIIKIACVFATHLIIIVEAFFSRNQLFEFWLKINEVDSKLLSRLEIGQAEDANNFRRSFVKKFFLNLIAVIVVEIIIISNIKDDSVWSNLWYLSFISLTITRLRHLHLMLHVDTISFRLKLIRKELEGVVTNSQLIHANSKAEPKDKRAFHKLCVMKNVYNSLYECVSHINFSFGFSELCNLMQNFIQLTCDLYWIYSILYRNDLNYIFVLILLLVPTFQVVIVVLSSCEKCLKEVREIGFLLHNVEKDEGDTSMDTLVRSKWS